MTERSAHLAQLRTEHARVSTLFASSSGDSPLNRRRLPLLQTILAALESAIWFEEAREAGEYRLDHHPGLEPVGAVAFVAEYALPPYFDQRGSQPLA